MAAPLANKSSLGQSGERQAMRAACGTQDIMGRVLGARRIAALAAALCTGFLLTSCAGTGSEDHFSAFVADHWPHWAGGMPNDVPPRPGAPGYQQFIAHGQADGEQPPPAGANGPAAAAAPPVFQTTPGAPAQPVRAQAAQAPAPAAPAAPAPISAQAAPPPPAAADSSIVQGGLY